MSGIGYKVNVKDAEQRDAAHRQTAVLKQSSSTHKLTASTISAPQSSPLVTAPSHRLFLPSVQRGRFRGRASKRQAQRSFLPSGLSWRLSARSSRRAWTTKAARTRLATNAARMAE